MKISQKSKVKSQNHSLKVKTKITLKVAVGLSGGVDSAVSAALLVEQGYEVTGVFLECYSGGSFDSAQDRFASGKRSGCRADEDRKDALAVALKLKIPFVVLDFKKQYKEKVLEYFFREYEAGRTPNPDTVCNREIKFGLFYEWALRPFDGSQGKPAFDYIATGHYARVMKVKSQKSKVKTTAKKLEPAEDWVLMRGVDEGKDQSYFLYQLRAEQLAHVLFPVGGMRKSQVRAKAKRLGLPVAQKPDSQGICFVGEVNVQSFLRERIRPKEGKMVYRIQLENSAREFIIGIHDGVWFYTVGQRVGKGLDKVKLKKMYEQGLFPYDPTKVPAMFVVEKDVANNRLVVGFEEETYKNQFGIGSMNWLELSIKNKVLSNHKTEVWVRIRNLGELVKARIQQENSAREKKKIIVELSKPIKGVAEGQACVFYSDDSVDAVVLGGGVITS